MEVKRYSLFLVAVFIYCEQFITPPPPPPPPPLLLKRGGRGIDRAAQGGEGSATFLTSISFFAVRQKKGEGRRRRRDSFWRLLIPEMREETEGEGGISLCCSAAVAAASAWKTRKKKRRSPPPLVSFFLRRYIAAYTTTYVRTGRASFFDRRNKREEIVFLLEAREAPHGKVSLAHRRQTRVQESRGGTDGEEEGESTSKKTNSGFGSAVAVSPSVRKRGGERRIFIPLCQETPPLLFPTPVLSDFFAWRAVRTWLPLSPPPGGGFAFKSSYEKRGKSALLPTCQFPLSSKSIRETTSCFSRGGKTRQKYQENLERKRPKKRESSLPPLPHPYHGAPPPPSSDISSSDIPALLLLLLLLLFIISFFSLPDLGQPPSFFFLAGDDGKNGDQRLRLRRRRRRRHHFGIWRHSNSACFSPHSPLFLGEK